MTPMIRGCRAVGESIKAVVPEGLRRIGKFAAGEGEGTGEETAVCTGVAGARGSSELRRRVPGESAMRRGIEAAEAAVRCRPGAAEASAAKAAVRGRSGVAAEATARRTMLGAGRDSSPSDDQHDRGEAPHGEILRLI